MDVINSGSAQDNQDDHLGYGVYAQTLWSRIQAALNRDLKRSDKSLGDDPLVVGIFGEWGSGKSFLLKQVLEKAQAEADSRIKAHREQDTEPLTVPVFSSPGNTNTKSTCWFPCCCTSSPTCSRPCSAPCPTTAATANGWMTKATRWPNTWASWSMCLAS
jgi:hypothetical protein